MRTTRRTAPAALALVAGLTLAGCSAEDATVQPEELQEASPGVEGTLPADATEEPTDG
jgi:hypothetical protein